MTFATCPNLKRLDTDPCANLGPITNVKWGVQKMKLFPGMSLIWLQLKPLALQARSRPNGTKAKLPTGGRASIDVFPSKPQTKAEIRDGLEVVDQVTVIGIQAIPSHGTAQVSNH